MSSSYQLHGLLHFRSKDAQIQPTLSLSSYVFTEKRYGERCSRADNSSDHLVHLAEPGFILRFSHSVHSGGGCVSEAPGSQGPPHADPVHRYTSPSPGAQPLVSSLVRGNLALPAPVSKTWNPLACQCCPAACSLCCQLPWELLQPLLAPVGSLSFPSTAWEPRVMDVPTSAPCCAPASPLHH